MPFALIAAVVIARLLIGPGAGLLPLLAIGPAIAAITPGLWITVAAGALASALAALLALAQPGTNTHQEVIALVSVAGVTAASVVVGVARRRRDAELAEVQGVALAAQRVLLRPVPDRVGPLALAVRYNSASARAQIGGDLYEALPTSWGLRLVIGDVRGKGLVAVQTAAAALGAFREAAYDEPSLRRVAARVEASLARQQEDEQFVSAVLAELPPDGAKAVLLNCGHPQPLLVHRGDARFLGPAEGDLPLGLADLATMPRHAIIVPIEPGDDLLFYTDGVSEARNAAGEFFPLAAAASLRAGLGAQEELAALSAEVRRHAGRPLSDDAALLLVRRLPDSVTRPAGHAAARPAADRQPTARP